MMKQYLNLKNGFLESWPWQEKEEATQPVEIENREEENVEEDGSIDSQSCMECLFVSFRKAWSSI